MRLYIRGFRTKNITARAIHLGEWLWQKKHNLPIQKSFNHWEVGYEDLTSGAISEGVVTRNYKEWLKTENAVDIVEYYIDLPEDEWKSVKDYLDEVEGTKYEYEMFWYYTLKLITGKWKGSTRPTQLFCVEHAIRALNKISDKVFNGKIDRLPTDAWPFELKNFCANFLIKNI